MSELNCRFHFSSVRNNYMLFKCLLKLTNLMHCPYSVFQKILVSKIFMHKRWRGGITVLSNFFCFTVPIKFVGEPFCVPKKFWYRKFFCRRGEGGYHGFVEKFLSHKTETENFVRESFCVSEIFRYGKKFVNNDGYSNIRKRKAVPNCRNSKKVLKQ